MVIHFMHWGIVSSYELGNTYIILFHKMSSIICRENVDLRPPEKSLDEQVMRRSVLFPKLVVSIMLVAIVFLAFFSIDTPLTQATLGAEDIFFEYGAESGTLRPPWDFAGATGSGSTAGSAIEVSTTHARTGTYSVRIYQGNPPKSDAQRRVGLKYWSHTSNEFYASWWTYFPTGFDDVVDAVSWFTMGGLKLYWGNPSDDGGKWSKGLRLAFALNKDGTGFYARPNWSGNDRTGQWNEPNWVNGDKEYIALNTWHHFQLYIKYGQSDGIVRGWVNNNLKLELTDIPTDPAYWGEPEVGDFWGRGSPYYPLIIEVYSTRDIASFEMWVDDVVLATEKVSEYYGVDYSLVDFENWENGFEEGDFSAWNGTQYANGGVQPSVTSTYAWKSTYSGNFATDGSLNSYARATRIIQNTTEIYQRSYIRFEDLPDTDGTTIWVLRVAQEDGTWMASAGVNRATGNYYWRMAETGGATNNTLDGINADEWYEVEFYFNATTNGQARLWVNGTLMCEMTGDFSGVGNIERVYPYIYISGGAQASAKTVYHDNYRVDNVKMDDRTDPRIASRIDLTAEPNVVLGSYGLSQITVQLKDQDNQTVAASGVAVTVEISFWSGSSTMKPVLFLAGQFGHLVTVTTDSDGLATIYIMAQGGAGTATLTASADGLSSGNTVLHVKTILLEDVH